MEFVIALASKPGQSSLRFLSYAIAGFIDGIREAIDMVRMQQLKVAWINYVHERFAALPDTKASDRQRSLVPAMPMGSNVPRSDLQGLTPKIAKMYAGAGLRVLSRGLNQLISRGLTRRSGREYRARSEAVEAFLPPIAPVDE
ncbi:MAG: hypothetical protein ACRDNZ_20715 [Streptosporangiaceae bacterium]